jgi:hypothetical protein
MTDPIEVKLLNEAEDVLVLTFDSSSTPTDYTTFFLRTVSHPRIRFASDSVRELFLWRIAAAFATLDDSALVAALAPLQAASLPPESRYHLTQALEYCFERRPRPPALVADLRSSISPWYSKLSAQAAAAASHPLTASTVVIWLGCFRPDYVRPDCHCEIKRLVSSGTLISPVSLGLDPARFRNRLVLGPGHLIPREVNWEKLCPTTFRMNGENYIEIQDYWLTIESSTLQDNPGRFGRGGIPARFMLYSGNSGNESAGFFDYNDKVLLILDRPIEGLVEREIAAFRADPNPEFAYEGVTVGMGSGSPIPFIEPEWNPEPVAIENFYGKPVKMLSNAAEIATRDEVHKSYGWQVPKLRKVAWNLMESESWVKHIWAQFDGEQGEGWLSSDSGALVETPQGCAAITDTIAACCIVEQDLQAWRTLAESVDI